MTYAYIVIVALVTTVEERWSDFLLVGKPLNKLEPKNKALLFIHMLLVAFLPYLRHTCD